MSSKPKTQNKLTAYESGQVERIAAWKSSYPNPLGELFRRAAQPVANMVETIIPDRIALLSIEAAYKASDRWATIADIKAQAGVREISELKHDSLETCDGLSRRVGTFSRAIAIVEGVLTGAGGVWTTLLDVPLLFTLCLRTIIKIGRCYGYPLDRPSDKAWVLGAFAVALSSTKEKRTNLTTRLRQIEELLLEETQEQVLVEEAASLLTQIEVFEDIPLFGAATGALLNLSVAHRTEATARHLFQERWLRDNGKIDKIEPAVDLGKIPALQGWSGAFARAGCSTAYGLGFLAAFPVSFLLGPVLRPFRSGGGQRTFAALSKPDGRGYGREGRRIGRKPEASAHGMPGPG
jgi:hypothetical protein